MYLSTTLLVAPIIPISTNKNVVALVDINYDFIKDFLAEYKATGEPGVNKIYFELSQDPDEASQYLYWHIKYMVDNGFLEGNNVEFHNITDLGRDLVNGITVKHTKESFYEKFKNFIQPASQAGSLVTNLYNLYKLFVE